MCGELLVDRWHQAVNGRDLSQAREVAAADIELWGPKGAAVGVDIFVEWIEHAGIHLTPVSWHPAGPSAAVVEQDAIWEDRQNEAQGTPALRVATWFKWSDGRIVLAARFNSLHEALIAASSADGEATSLCHDRAGSA